MMQNWPANAFLDVPEENAQLETSRFVILPIRYDGTGGAREGARFGPDAIINASQHVELFDEQFHDEFHQAGIHTHPAVVCGNMSVQEVQQRILDTATSLTTKEKTIVALGGDHSISPPLIKACCEVWPQLSVLHFGAHANLRMTHRDSPYNEACAMRRVHELGRTIINIGLRGFSREEHEFMRENDILSITPQTVANDPRGTIQQLMSKLAGHVYISFDIGACDPSLTPGTSHPEPGGLNYKDVLTILESVSRNRQIVAADVVEVNPIGHHVTEFVAARLAYKIITFAQLRS